MHVNYNFIPCREKAIRNHMLPVPVGMSSSESWKEHSIQTSHPYTWTNVTASLYGISLISPLCIILKSYSCGRTAVKVASHVFLHAQKPTATAASHAGRYQAQLFPRPLTLGAHGFSHPCLPLLPPVWSRSLIRFLSKDWEIRKIQ